MPRSLSGAGCPVGAAWLAAVLEAVSQQASRVLEASIPRRVRVFMLCVFIPCGFANWQDALLFRHPERARNRKYHGASFRAAPEYSGAQLR